MFEDESVFLVVAVVHLVLLRTYVLDGGEHFVVLVVHAILEI